MNYLIYILLYKYLSDLSFLKKLNMKSYKNLSLFINSNITTIVKTLKHIHLSSSKLNKSENVFIKVEIPILFLTEIL